MTVTIGVWFDFICPFSVMTRKVIRDTLDLTDPHVPVLHHPFEMHPDGIPATGKREYPDQVWERSVLPMAQRLGVAFPATPAPFLPDTGPALRGHHYAARHGLSDTYDARVFDAFFQEQQDIGDLAVLTHLAAQTGLDPGEFAAHLTSPADLARHRAAQEAARSVWGIHTAPTITIGRWRTEGVPDAGRLAEVLAHARTTDRRPTPPARARRQPAPARR
ncbi:DsbA family oxidoreductase [Streptomyces purpureus]|uniref:2-hydroxychromene-2-carboxylate isomerase n=1 Tax=Streptomyces purpureus TaxID=1951 RepID=A0A918HIU5_9ACTN|nr:DsbA family protein [Streptomyces purpureus]GGT64309.1 2-hydroxychromene-2-carboxylate isomerase [Streptomyces purpureus]